MDKSDLDSLQLQNNMTDENLSYYIDYDDLLCRKAVGVKDASIPLLFISVVVLSCICDILVLGFLALYKNLRSLNSVFFLNLALSNLLLTFGLLFHAAYYWGWTFGEIGCKAVKFLFDFGFYSSVLFLTLMTVQHYMAVVHSLSDWESYRGLTVASFIVWTLSGTVALLGSLHSQLMIEYGSKCEYGSVEWKSGIACFQNAFFFIAFIIMFFCYSSKLRSITKSYTNKRHKTVRLTFFIVLVFFIGWAPYNIVMFLKSLNIHPFTDCEVSIRLDHAEYHACRILAITQCYVHTVVFLVFVDGRLRNSL